MNYTQKINHRSYFEKVKNNIIISVMHNRCGCRDEFYPIGHLYQEQKGWKNILTGYD